MSRCFFQLLNQLHYITGCNLWLTMKLLICPSLATTEKYSVILLKEIGGCPCKLRRICEDTGVHAKLRGWIVSKPILKTKMVTRQRRRAYKTAREVHGTKRRVSKSEEFSEEVLKKRILYGQNSWLRKREASKAEASSSSNDMSAPPDHALTAVSRSQHSHKNSSTSRVFT